MKLKNMKINIIKTVSNMLVAGIAVTDPVVGLHPSSVLAMKY